MSLRPDKTRVSGFTAPEARMATLNASDSLGASLGDLRRFVAEADALELPDTAYVKVGRVSRDSTNTDELYAGEFTVRSLPWSRRDSGVGS